MRKLPLQLSRLTSKEAASIVEGSHTTVVLLPVGGTQPHGPHLPLGTDLVVTKEVCRRSAVELRDNDVAAVIAPHLPYGAGRGGEAAVGTVSLTAEMVQRLAADLCRAYLRDGWHHVSLVNHHLGHEQVAALHAAVVEVNESGGGAEETGTVPVSFPNVLSRRWLATLPGELRTGSSHAGRYESSLLLAADPDEVRRELMKGLDPCDEPLHAADGYRGDPASATADEGRALLDKLVRMVVTEVLEAIGKSDC
ncbi:MAG: creatininase family protein [Myxococcota bacterium]